MIEEMTGLGSENGKGSARENGKESEKRNASQKGSELVREREKKKGSESVKERGKGNESEKNEREKESVKGNESEIANGTMKEKETVNEAGTERENVLEIGKTKIKVEKIAETKGRICGMKEIKKNYMMIENQKFKAILKKQLSQPEKKFANRKYLEARYPFPQDTKEWIDPPEVDPPVSRLAAQTLLSLPDSSTLRDTADRQVERMARSIFEAAGASLAPVFASVWAATAILAWAKNLQAGLQASAPELSDQAVQIAVIADYMLHAALDSARGVAGIASNAITIWRILWLREWKAEPASKKSLIHLPYLSG
ncbi:unnamed protein product [Ranitomeya imitator]|uniref:Uncharacterized protein n=1 Tax=Ranitomeya imitator TaxID=111125 RepID=A0ABN9LIA8_9NEOB|nr:unnamed protein product [Ranitomeya imitator]